MYRLYWACLRGSGARPTADKHCEMLQAPNQPVVKIAGRRSWLHSLAVWSITISWMQEAACGLSTSSLPVAVLGLLNAPHSWQAEYLCLVIVRDVPMRLLRCPTYLDWKSQSWHEYIALHVQLLNTCFKQPAWAPNPPLSISQWVWTSMQTECTCKHVVGSMGAALHTGRSCFHIFYILHCNLSEITLPEKDKASCTS